MSDKHEPQVAEALQSISASVSQLVSEEIALAKAEVSHKISRLGVGSGIGVAAGAFLFFALITASHALAWGLFALTGGTHVWLGYLLATIIFILLGLLAGFAAYRILSKSGAPVPTQALAEVQATKQAVTDARRNA